MSYEPYNEDFDDQGELRSRECEWEEYTYPDDRGDAVERSITKKRGCSSTAGLIIAGILLPFIAFYALVTTIIACVPATLNWVLDE